MTIWSSGKSQKVGVEELGLVMAIVSGAVSAPVMASASGTIFLIYNYGLKEGYARNCICDQVC